MASVQIIYASTSGHTEYVIDAFMNAFKGHECTKIRAEIASKEDVLKGDVLILASGSWNTGSIEGQLNPHMHQLLKKTAADIDLKGHNIALIGLGDDRYHYTCGAADHLEEFVRDHGGEQIGETLRMINEPYGQEKKITEWAQSLQSQIT